MRSESNAGGSGFRPARDAVRRSAKAGSRRAKSWRQSAQEAQKVPTRAGRHCGTTVPQRPGGGEVAKSHSWPLATARLPDTKARHGRDRLGERGRHSAQRVLGSRCSTKGQQQPCDLGIL